MSFKLSLRERTCSINTSPEVLGFGFFGSEVSIELQLNPYHKIVDQMIQREELKIPGPRSCSPREFCQFISPNLGPKVRDEGEKVYASREQKTSAQPHSNLTTTVSWGFLLFFHGNMYGASIATTFII